MTSLHGGTILSQVKFPAGRWLPAKHPPTKTSDSGAVFVELRESQRAHLQGVEPRTSRFVVWRSIQLSYRCVKRAREQASIHREAQARICLRRADFTRHRNPRPRANR